MAAVHEQGIMHIAGGRRQHCTCVTVFIAIWLSCGGRGSCCSSPAAQQHIADSSSAMQQCNAALLASQ